MLDKLYHLWYNIGGKVELIVPMPFRAAPEAPGKQLSPLPTRLPCPIYCSGG